MMALLYIIHAWNIVSPPCINIMISSRQAFVIMYIVYSTDKQLRFVVVVAACLTVML